MERTLGIWREKIDPSPRYCRENTRKEEREMGPYPVTCPDGLMHRALIGVLGKSCLRSDKYLSWIKHCPDHT